jgi:hypothetical protein
MNITHGVCAFVALGVQLATRNRHVVVYGLPRSKRFYRIILKQ